MGLFLYIYYFVLAAKLCFMRNVLFSRSRTYIFRQMRRTGSFLNWIPSRYFLFLKVATLFLGSQVIGLPHISFYLEKLLKLEKSGRSRSLHHKFLPKA